MKKALTLTLAITFAAIMIVVLFVYLGLTSSPLNENTNPTVTPIVTQIPQPTPSSGPFVEVNYKPIGWFYSNNTVQDKSYNYTYLVLNITITNHKYEQINLRQSYGFTVNIQNKEYEPTSAPPLLIFNSSRSSDYYSYPSTMPRSPLVDNESLNGYVIFEFGDSNIKPPPAQIINVPFTLQYSVTYGNQDDSSHEATVVVNQIY